MSAQTELAKKLAMRLKLLGANNVESLNRSGINPEKIWYHGTNRLDRLLESPRLLKSRSTSGPMPFFTENPEIASNYAKGKRDTSIMSTGYEDWFTFPTEGNKKVNLDQIYYYLTPKQRASVGESLKNQSIEQELGGLDHWNWTLKDQRNDPIRAAKEIWLNSGNLYGNERDFLNVLDKAGLNDVLYTSPNLEAPGVFPAIIESSKPFFTTPENIKEIIPALDSQRGRQKFRFNSGVDPWDKNYVSVGEFSDRLKAGLREDHTSAFTSIPDRVTKLLSDKGYDSILDTGGKLGGPAHKVIIPFSPKQVIPALDADRILKLKLKALED